MHRNRRRFVPFRCGIVKFAFFYIDFLSKGHKPHSVVCRAVSKPSKQDSVLLLPQVVLRQCCCTTSAWPLLLVPVLAWPFPHCRRQGRAGWDTDYSNMLSSQLQLSLSCSPRSQLSHSETQSNLCPKFAIVSLRLTF